MRPLRSLIKDGVDGKKTSRNIGESPVPGGNSAGSINQKIEEHEERGWEPGIKFAWKGKTLL